MIDSMDSKRTKKNKRIWRNAMLTDTQRSDFLLESWVSCGYHILRTGHTYSTVARYCTVYCTARFPL